MFKDPLAHHVPHPTHPVGYSRYTFVQKYPGLLLIAVSTVFTRVSQLKSVALHHFPPPPKESELRSSQPSCDGASRSGCRALFPSSLPRALPHSPAGYGELHLGGWHSGGRGLQGSRRRHLRRQPPEALGGTRGALHGVGRRQETPSIAAPASCSV